MFAARLLSPSVRCYILSIIAHYFISCKCRVKNLFAVIIIKEAVLYPVLFVGENRVDIDILNAAEYALFNVGIALFKLADELLCLLTL